MYSVMITCNGHIRVFLAFFYLIYVPALKKKVRAFEESFETEHGHKPSAHEKNSKIEIKKALADLAKSRKELKS